VLQNVAMFGSVFPLIERVNEGFVLGKSLRLTTNKLDFKLFVVFLGGVPPPSSEETLAMRVFVGGGGCA